MTYGIEFRNKCKYASFIILMFVMSASCQVLHPQDFSGNAQELQKNIDHIVILYLENRSFDNLFYEFPNANTADKASYLPQSDTHGRVYDVLPGVPGEPRIPAQQTNAPFLIDQYLPQNQPMPDATHKFYQNKWQINDGKNDRFVAHTNAGGLVMGYHDMSKSHLWKYAREFTLCDNFFQAAFGGSFLNHQWLVAATTPAYPNAPDSLKVQNEADPSHFKDNVVTSDGYVVNNVTPTWPTTRPADSPLTLPPLSNPNIGDRLSAKGVSWKWYAGGWNAAVADPQKAAAPPIRFQFHHQPFPFFKSCMRGTDCFNNNLKDRDDLLADIKNGSLPSVAFYKPDGTHNQHPGYANVDEADNEIALIVDAIMNSSMWGRIVIIITYDENGGLWDHVAPPKGDRWGPGSRVPTVVISPFARKGYVDHTQYDTTSILKLIEIRYKLAPLADRDAKAADMLQAFDFQ